MLGLLQTPSASGSTFPPLRNLPKAVCPLGSAPELGVPAHVQDSLPP